MPLVSTTVGQCVRGSKLPGGGVQFAQRASEHCPDARSCCPCGARRRPPGRGEGVLALRFAIASEAPGALAAPPPLRLRPRCLPRARVPRRSSPASAHRCARPVRPHRRVSCRRRASGLLVCARASGRIRFRPAVDFRPRIRLRPKDCASHAATRSDPSRWLRSPSLGQLSGQAPGLKCLDRSGWLRMPPTPHTRFPRARRGLGPHLRWTRLRLRSGSRRPARRRCPSRRLRRRGARQFRPMG